jgi:putative phosphoribosyl transferase
LEISIPLQNNEFLKGILNTPFNSKSLIIFAHGSGSNISSPRNRYVAGVLNGDGFATLLVDLLTPQEQDSDIKSQKVMGKYPGIVLNKFNIHLLSNRLTSITNWMIKDSNVFTAKVKDLPIGYLGASTGAAACIEASVSSSYSDKIYAIVSRGGRPDLAGSDALKKVKSATLLIVGEEDSKDMKSLNKKALKQLKNTRHKDLAMIHNAGHLFDEEEGLIEKVADMTVQWFKKSLEIK